MNEFRASNQEPRTALTIREKFGYLPFPLPYILEAEGEDFMFEVVERLGGRGLSIPLSGTPAPRSVLVRELGEEKARRLAMLLGGMGIIRLDVPTMRATQARAAEVRIIHARACGQTVAAIAISEGMTERGVYKALDRAKRAGVTPTTPMLRDPRRVIPSPKRRHCGG